jgi:hypothetical protein
MAMDTLAIVARDPGSGERPLTVSAVRARVVLSSTALREMEAAGSGGVFNGAGEHDADRVSLTVYLSATLSDGRTVGGAVPDLGLGGPRRGIWHRWHGPSLPGDEEQVSHGLRAHRVDVHDIEDGINQMLGRDPSLHRPPRLSWGGLIDALAAGGVTATESELVEVPMTVRLMPDVLSDLSRH